MEQVDIDVEDNIRTMDDSSIWDDEEREYFKKHIKPQLLKKLKEIKT